MTGEPAEVWAACEYGCSCELGEYAEGTSVLALFTSRQTAKQWADMRVGVIMVHRMPVFTSIASMPEYLRHRA